MSRTISPAGVCVRRSGPQLPFRVPVIPAHLAVSAMALFIIVTAVAALVAVVV